MKKNYSAPASTYDILSRWYGFLSDSSEGPFRREALEHLRLVEGESLLEVGSGTGTELAGIARQVGKTGKVCGLDLSKGMLSQCSRKIQNDADAQVFLINANGLSLPFRRNTFDAVFLSFTLELFPEDEISEVLHETLRVLCPTGRICIVSLSDSHSEEIPTRIYGWLHRLFPGVIDCRPIDVPRLLEGCGYGVVRMVEKQMWGLRVSMTIAQIAVSAGEAR